MFSKNKIVDLPKLLELIQTPLHQQQKIIFTNGCFDLLHPGHIDYLENAKTLGDILIIGVNSDTSVKRLKGTSRPINSQEHRALILAALQCVDYVVFFEEDTPINLITQIKPSILVKGGDYRIDQIVGAKEVKGNGGIVKSLAFLAGYSSTAIIDKIKKNA